LSRRGRTAVGDDPWSYDAGRDRKKKPNRPGTERKFGMKRHDEGKMNRGINDYDREVKSSSGTVARHVKEKKREEKLQPAAVGANL